MNDGHGLNLPMTTPQLAQQAPVEMEVGKVLDGRIILKFSRPTDNVVMTVDEAAQLIAGLRQTMGVGLVG